MAGALGDSVDEMLFKAVAEQSNVLTAIYTQEEDACGLLRDLSGSWLEENQIEVLNVAGPRASKDGKIYNAVFKLIESVYYLEMMNSGQPHAVGFRESGDSVDRRPPKTVKDAVQRLIDNLPLKEKITIANMVEDELLNLNAYLGRYILDKFSLWSGNEELVESCLALVDYPLHNEDDAAAVIIKELWRTLRKTHRLRIVK